MKIKEAKNGLDKSQDEAELSELMRQSQAGNGKSYQVLLTRVRHLLIKYEDDVLQDILLAIHTKRHTYDPTQFFLPWMYAIARYKAIDYFRKNKIALKATVSIDDEMDEIENLAVFENTDDRDVLALCESLPEKQKQVLKLVKIEGLSIEEAATKTGYSVSDIKVTVHRAIKTLQEKVKGDENEN